MKKIIGFLLVCTLITGELLAQQIPLYSQYFHNPFIYNPAQTGFSGDPQLYFMYRRQWTGFEGAPETRAASFDMATKNKKAGFGAYFYNDISNIFTRYAASLSYAYHLNFSENHRLSMGLSAGFLDTHIDYSKVFVTNNDDAAINNNLQRSTSFDANAGINYYLKGWNLGFSVPQILATELRHIDTDEEANYRLDRHYILQTSYRIGLLDDNLFITPQIIGRTNDFSNFSFDAGAQFSYKDMVWIGGAYRYDYGVTFNGGFRVHNMVSVGYSYDMGLNALSDYNNGSHEIMLGIRFGRKQKKLDDLTEDNFGRMKDVVDKQDSIIQNLQAQIDSLEMKLNAKADRDSEDFSDIDDAESIKDLLEKIQDMQQQINDMEEGSSQDDKTRVIQRDDLEHISGAPLGDYYMVLGSFKVRDNAYNFMKDLEERGFNVGTVYNKKRAWHYVYISQPDDLKTGYRELYKFREENQEFSDAWIYIVR
ncbi:MAG: PorP/SprF family type IX secretion system membrane protein [Chitinophagales bacterium]